MLYSLNHPRLLIEVMCKWEGLLHFLLSISTLPLTSTTNNHCLRMKALLLCALVLFCGLQAAQCCSCVSYALSRSRPTAIRDDFCFRYIIIIYLLHLYMRSIYTLALFIASYIRLHAISTLHAKPVSWCSFI